MPLRRVHALSEKPLSQMQYAAIGVGPGASPDILHCGIFFVDTRGPDNVMLLHLKFHHDLACEAPPPEYLWVELTIPTERARVLARFCRAIEKRYPDGRFPYGLKHDGAFDDSGQYLSNEGKGLTCATFVLAVFAKQGVHLVDSAGWVSRKDDKAAQTKLVDLLIKVGAEASHVDAVRKEIGCVRFRSEEVAAAGASEPLPVSFEQASRVGALVREKLLKQIVT